MLFNSYDFWSFFLIVFAVHWSFRRIRFQNLLLIAASCLFYGLWGWRFLALLLATTVMDFYCGLRAASAGTPRGRKTFLWISIATHLAVLGAFKYYDFFALNVQDQLARWGVDASLPLLQVVLPVGLSFYTFDSMSYVIDVYRRVIPPTTNLWTYVLYVTFFPQLVAGPNERAGHMLPQFERPRVFRLEQFYEGCFLILWGLYQKVFVADNLDSWTRPIFDDPGAWSGGAVLVCAYAYVFQLYADFSGYCDMALGMAKCLGFELTVNFKAPFFARSMAELWGRRWNITVSAWFRDYVFPLFRPRQRPYAAIFLTMLLMGFWHGARWTMLGLGAVAGLFIILGNVLSRRTSWIPPAWRQVLGIVATFHGFVFVVLFFFRPESLLDSVVLMEKLLLDLSMGPPAYEFAWSALSLAGLVLVVQYAQYRTDDILAVYRMGPTVRCIFYLYIFAALFIFGENHARRYIYFQF